MGRNQNRILVENAILLDGETGYKTGRDGSRWYVTNPTVNTAVTGQTSFAAGTSFMTFDTNSSTRMIPNSIILAQTGTVAGGAIGIILATDTINRISSGTTMTPVPTYRESTTTTGVTVKHTVTNLTASSVQYFAPIVIPNVLSTTTTISLGDAYGIGASSSFLIYCFAATTGASLFFNVEWIEETTSTG